MTWDNVYSSNQRTDETNERTKQMSSVKLYDAEELISWEVKWKQKDYSKFNLMCWNVVKMKTSNVKIGLDLSKPMLWFCLIPQDINYYICSQYQQHSY